MVEFDLNLNNYKLHQILSFFGYKNTDIFTNDDLYARSESLRTQLIASGRIPATSLPDFDVFITEATRWVAAVKCPRRNISPPPPPPKSPPRIRMPIPTAQSVIPPTQPPQTDPSIQPHPYVVPTNFTVGTRNPLQNPTIQKYITIDSRQRENYYSTSPSDFIMELPEKLSRVVDMRLTAFEIPMSFYNISSSLQNQFFTLNIACSTPNTTSGVETFTRIIVVEDGNYNALDLINTLNSIVAPRDQDGDLIYPENAFSYVDFSLHITDTGGGTGKVTVAFTPNDKYIIHNLELQFGNYLSGETDDRTELSQKLGWVLGFQKRTYTNAITHTGESIIDPGGLRYLYLAVDDYQRAVSTAFLSTRIPSDAFARITVKGTYFSLLMSDNLNYITEPRRYFGPVTIQKLRIRLLDEWGRPLHMNSANFSLCFTFTILYDMAM